MFCFRVFYWDRQNNVECYETKYFERRGDVYGFCAQLENKGSIVRAIKREKD